MSRTRQVALNAPSSSQVQLTPQASRDSSAVRISGTLRLRAAENDAVRTNNDQDRRIRWSEDVIDNEGMGKKSSKVCCIYHKARPVGESSSEEDSDSSSSDSDSDSEIDCHRHRSRPHAHAHDKAGDNPDQNASQQSLDRGRASCCSNLHGRKSKQRKPSPNAYEKMPKNKSHQKIQGR